jgi:hypothetical protein
VLSLSRSLNEELKLAGETGIKVGTIMLWAVDTPWWIHAANYTGHAPRMAMMDDPHRPRLPDPKEEQPVGWKAKTGDLSHHLAPKMTERMSAKHTKVESEKASFAPENTGAIYAPMDDGLRMDGGLRERMKQEDEART